MEGVEDVPEVVMIEGLPWNWETFPEYLDALDDRRLDIDVATQLPHSALRVFVKIGRASCRERVCQYVQITVGAVSLKKKKQNNNRLRTTSTQILESTVYIYKKNIKD